MRPIESASFDLIGYEGTLPEGAHPIIERICKPAGRQVVMGAAGRCLNLTKARQQDGMDLRLMIEGFADELAEFPEDVVATAFRKWAQREKWWPSLAEIRDQCQRLNRVRRSLKRLAERGLEP